jgi:hypothetical protein
VAWEKYFGRTLACQLCLSTLLSTQVSTFQAKNQSQLSKYLDGHLSSQTLRPLKFSLSFGESLTNASVPFPGGRPPPPAPRSGRGEAGWGGGGCQPPFLLNRHRRLLAAIFSGVFTEVFASRTVMLIIMLSPMVAVGPV